MQEKTLSPQKAADEPKKRKFMGIPMTENMITGIKYLGPIVAIAALELGFGAYSECNRTKRAEAVHPAANAQTQSTDMPVPDYSWTKPVVKGVKELSKGSGYTGQ